MTEFNLSDKLFRFSLQIMDLYVQLLKNGEYELAEKILKSALQIREQAELSFGTKSREDAMAALSLAFNSAVQTRFWIKLLQMKHDVHSLCDEPVDAVNEIITILNYLSTENNSLKLNLQYQVN